MDQKTRATASWTLIDDAAFKLMLSHNIISECTPPGLLLSLGDGSAITMTREMLFAAIKAGVCAVNAQGHPVVFTSDMPLIMDKIIQQAQEARDGEAS